MLSTYDYVFYVLKHQRKIQHLAEYEKIAAINDNICNRCKSVVAQNYCENCCEMGKLNKGDYLYRIKGPLKIIKYQDHLTNLSLTKLQAQASNFIIDNIKNHQNMLIWAVCGAGKTEISFQAIEYVLQHQGLVAFCIPRVDILYEISKRLKEFFPNTLISIVNGTIKQQQDTQIYVITTNQLLKVKHRFDLVIVDEVDAFPFSVDQKFMQGVYDSLTAKGVFCCLTSTPSTSIKQLNLKTFLIYKRWHDNLLPVAKLCKYHLQYPLYYQYILRKIIHKLNKPTLFFVCNIKNGMLLAQYLKRKYPHLNISYVNSQSEKRSAIIQQFYEEKLDILISTPILERGVTFKNIDVYVLDADNELYNEASLIQMAGRANRKKEYQTGRVYFYYQTLTTSIKECNKQITMMNDLLIKEKQK